MVHSGDRRADEMGMDRTDRKCWCELMTHTALLVPTAPPAADGLTHGPGGP